jgi:hypothetical protein
LAHRRAVQRRSLLASAGLILAAGTARGAGSGPVLVELFTSQGCSSCPPADSAFARLLDRPDVLPLAFHVTYWDRLGWRDTLGDPAFTERQHWYAGILGRGVYTPQMVLAGELDLVGSDPRLDRALDLVRRQRPTLPIEIAADAVARLPDAAVEGDLRLTAIGYDPHHRVAIERGENAGRSIDYYNTVRALTDLGDWDGKAARVDLGAVAVAHPGLALIAQDRATGRVAALGVLDRQPTTL